MLGRKGLPCELTVKILSRPYLGPDAPAYLKVFSPPNPQAMLKMCVPPGYGLLKSKSILQL